jgi:lysophospholipase L1-like esterase
VNYYFDKTVLKYAPRAIVLYAGDNDIANGKSALRVFEDYKSFVALVNEKLPVTPIIFISIKPSLRRWSFWPVMEKTNTLIKTYANKYPALYYADTATPMLNAAGQPNPALFVSDSLHLSQHGYDLWSARLEPVLKQALQAVR